MLWGTLSTCPIFQKAAGTWDTCPTAGRRLELYGLAARANSTAFAILSSRGRLSGPSADSPFAHRWRTAHGVCPLRHARLASSSPWVKRQGELRSWPLGFVQVRVEDAHRRISRQVLEQ